MGWHTVGDIWSLRTMLQPLVSTSQELDEERLLLTTRTSCTKLLRHYFTTIGRERCASIPQGIHNAS